MRLNDDLSERVMLRAGELDWVPSPVAGVDRRMLFRLGGEKARATSIVRYAPDSHFTGHRHPGGEEFVVLDGVFQDEHGSYPAGSYVRNPPGSGHSPGTDPGCVIFVKLWQFHRDDRTRVVRLPGEGERADLPGGGHCTLLYEGHDEQVRFEDWPAGGTRMLPNPQGLELFLLDGAIQWEGCTLDRHAWLRLPAGERFQAQAAGAGARVWIKEGPLLHAQVCDFAA